MHGETSEERWEAVAAIRNEGDLSLVPELLDIHLQPGGEHESFELYTLLSDIKESAFRELVISRLQSVKEDFQKSRLLRVCWGSALDYSSYAPLFAKMTVEEPLAVAFEASTVLLNSHRITDNDRQASLAILEQGCKDEAKQMIIGDVVAFLTTPPEEEEENEENEPDECEGECHD